MTTLSGILDAYEASIRQDKPIPALLGAFIAGVYQTTVVSNPALTYIRFLDNTASTAKHRNRVDLTSADQSIPIAVYYDEYDELSVWGLEPKQAGASLQVNPVVGPGGIKTIVAGSNVTVDNTDPVNPIVSSTGGSGSGFAPYLIWDLTLGSAGIFDTNSVDDHGNSGAFATDYFWLELRWDLRGAASTTGVPTRIAFNNDTTDSNYQAADNLQGSNVLVVFNNNSRNLVSTPADTATANYFGQGGAIIPNPGSAHFKSINSSATDARSNAFHDIDAVSVLWRSTSAITRITLDANDATTTFVTGSRLTVIGYK